LDRRLGKMMFCLEPDRLEDKKVVIDENDEGCVLEAKKEPTQLEESISNKCK
jgi:hypothetical protein